MRAQGRQGAALAVLGVAELLALCAALAPDVVRVVAYRGRGLVLRQPPCTPASWEAAAAAAAAGASAVPP